MFINPVRQFSYLIQLITDANGVLVFLKFLTEKFNQISTDFESIVKDGTPFEKFLGISVY